MSNEYTPTTDEVRTCAEGDTPYTSLEEGAFARWLDKDRAKAQVEALLEQSDELNRLANTKSLIEAADKYAGYYAGVRAARQEDELLTRGRADRIAREAGIETGENDG